MKEQPHDSPASHTQYFYKNSPNGIVGANGYNEPSLYKTGGWRQELVSPDIGEVHKSTDPLGQGEFNPLAM